MGFDDLQRILGQRPHSDPLEEILNTMRAEDERYPNLGEASRRIRQQQMPFGFSINQEQDKLCVEVIEWDQVLKLPRKHVESRVIDAPGIENITGEKAK